MVPNLRILKEKGVKTERKKIKVAKKQI